MKIFNYKILPTLVVIIFLISACTSQTNGPTRNEGKITDKQVTLNQNMRKLWVDHIFWTRSYVVAALDVGPGVNEVLDRLMRNQEDIGSAINSYYGSTAGSQLTDLLKEHISLAGQVVVAAKAGDQTKLAQANTAWIKNADDIANFLASANPNWNKTELTTMMREHLSLLTDHVEARINKQYTQDIAATDASLNQILILADELSDGIIKQFPDKF